MVDTPRLAVHVRATIRGASIDAAGSVRLFEEVVYVQVDEREHAIRLDRLDGVVWETPVLTLHVAADALELTGHAGLQPFAQQLISSALVLPEFTRTMHGLGSRRGRPGAEHDRFFAGLLAARRAAQGFTEPDSRLSAFDARRLTQAMSSLLTELAAERYPESAPDRRALEAELNECAERLYASLDSLGAAADEVKASAGATRLARWRDWTRAAHIVFQEADRCWIAVLPALASAPNAPPKRRFWRRANSLVVALPATLASSVMLTHTSSLT